MDHFEEVKTSIDFNVNPNVWNQDELKQAFKNKALLTFVIVLLTLYFLSFLVLLNEKYNLIKRIKSRITFISIHGKEFVDEGLRKKMCFGISFALLSCLLGIALPITLLSHTNNNSNIRHFGKSLLR